MADNAELAGGELLAEQTVEASTNLIDLTEARMSRDSHQLGKVSLGEYAAGMYESV